MTESSIDQMLRRKKEIKKILSKSLNFAYCKPLLGIFLDRELSKNDEEKLIKSLEGISAVDIEVVVLADSNLEAMAIPNVTIFPYNRTNREALLEASDMAIAFEFTDVEEFLIHGIIPISSMNSKVMDYDPNHETGNSFVYKQNDPWAVFAALVRARETFKFPYDWKHIIRQGIRSVCKI